MLRTAAGRPPAANPNPETMVHRILPSRPLSCCALALAVGCLAANASAQEHRLKDGRVLVGEKTERGDLVEVATRDGAVLVPADSILETIDVADLRKRLRDTAKASGDSAFAHLQLGKLARDTGLERDMWRHLDAALEQLEDEAAGSAPGPVLRRLRDLLAQLEPELLPRELRQAPTKKRVEQILRMFRANVRGSREAALIELLVREPQADQVLRVHARRNSNARQRQAALAALQRRPLAGNDRFVLLSAVVDRSEDVRERAIELARPTADEELVQFMASGFGHPEGRVRAMTAQALGGLGHPSAIPLLVKAGPLAGTALRAASGDNSPRGHIAFLNQQAYIRDFDVEVAQASFIADPRVDVLQSGSVLDVRVAGVFEIRTITRYYRASLKQLTNSDPGADPRRWSEWLESLPKAVTTGASDEKK